MGQKFEYLEHLSDAGIKFYGDTPEEIFENAALGMFSLVSDIDSVKPEKKVDIDLVSESSNLEDMLVLWLEKLLYHFEVDEMLFSGFKVISLKKYGESYKLAASILGEKVDYRRHEIKIGIKAPTYHQLAIKNKNHKWWGRVIFDI